MAMLLEELIRSIELWLRIAKTALPLVNPNLDPVLLVPGIAGSILNSVDADGSEERVWVRILGADHEFRTKLWSRFDPSTGKTVSLDERTTIAVPEDRYGLYAIDILDPDMIIGREGVYYYHDMIVEMIKWGYQEGKTLFGFGYDFRQSNRLQDTLDRFQAKLESIFTLSGGKKITIVTHSMGGLLVKCFLSLHNEIFEKFVKSWIAIAAPFQGAPGYVTSSLLNGCSFVDGWEQNFFISKWSMHQLLIECPSMYELMGCPSFCWDDVPLLQLWRARVDGSDNLTTLLESYELADVISVMRGALLENTVSHNSLQLPMPFNAEIFKWATETRKLLSVAKLPESVNFYNIYGMNLDTPHTVCYGSKDIPISDLKEILHHEAKYIYVNGDGTVPAESAMADGFNAVARVGVPAEHRQIVGDRHVFRILRHWLRAGDPDPFYNPLNDYVILPAAFEIERLTDGGQITASLNKEEWEILSSSDYPDNGDCELPSSSGDPLVAAAAAAVTGNVMTISHRHLLGKEQQPIAEDDGLLQATLAVEGVAVTV